MIQISANGLRFNAAVAGQGPRLLFLTGTGADLRKANTPLTTPLVDQFTVLTYDQRGLGQSDKPDCPYTVKDYARDAKAIMDELEWDRVMVVGYSFGGMVAQELAINWPERVDRLVLCATTAGGAGGASFPLETLTALPPYERARKGLEVMDLAFTKDWQTANPDLAHARIEARVAAQAQFSDEPGFATGRKRQLAARAAHNTYDRLNRITSPTYVLAGSRDGQAPLAAQEAMANAIPNARFEVIDGGHNMLWQGPECLHRITEFLR